MWAGPNGPDLPTDQWAGVVDLGWTHAASLAHGSWLELAHLSVRHSWAASILPNLRRTHTRLH